MLALQRNAAGHLFCGICSKAYQERAQKKQAAAAAAAAANGGPHIKPTPYSPAAIPTPLASSSVRPSFGAPAGLFLLVFVVFVVLSRRFSRCRGDAHGK